MDEYHIDYLKSKFTLNKYPNNADINQMVAETNLKFERIYYWFARERTKSCRNNVDRFFSTETVQILLKELKKNKYPSTIEKKQFAEQLDLSFEQVDNWFAKNRSKSRAEIAKKQAILNQNKSIRRFNFNTNQKEYLFNEFEINTRPSENEIKNIALKLNVKPSSVKNWFLKKRMFTGDFIKRKYSKETVDVLRKEFKLNCYPNYDEKQRIALSAHLSVKQVGRWFMRARNKTKEFFS